VCLAIPGNARFSNSLRVLNSLHLTICQGSGGSQAGRFGTAYHGGTESPRVSAVIAVNAFEPAMLVTAASVLRDVAKPPRTADIAGRRSRPSVASMRLQELRSACEAPLHHRPVVVICTARVTYTRDNK
jgi:hypothetical protein